MNTQKQQTLEEAVVEAFNIAKDNDHIEDMLDWSAEEIADDMLMYSGEVHDAVNNTIARILREKCGVAK